MAEEIDIYDRDRKETGLRLPRKAKLAPDQYMLYALALIENQDHRFLITQRSLDKKWAAGAWEIPGGGAQAGEDSFRSVCRETMEEVGLDVSGCEPTPIYSYRNDDAESGDNYFADIYHFHLDFTEDDVKLQKEEAIGFRLATEDEITELGKKGMFLHDRRIKLALENERGNIVGRE
ncbi:NUDIX domain-containing protein [Lachnospiraceae bacterium]|nr:NUDIX domain-containing protein [Lachnospiraceae bacterium]